MRLRKGTFYITEAEQDGAWLSARVLLLKLHLQIWHGVLVDLLAAESRKR